MQAQYNRTHARGPALKADTHFRRGLALHKAGGLEQAIAAYATAVRLMPRHAEALCAMGAALKAAGRPGEAIAAWQKAVQARPEDAAIAAALGEALLDAKRGDEAARHLITACGHHPEDVRLLTLNGRALIAARQAGAAIGVLYMALELQPNHAEAHAQLAQAFYHDGDWDQMLSHCVQAYELAPSEGSATMLAAALVELEHYEQALLLADHALALCPTYAKAMMARAQALDGLLRHEECISVAEQAAAGGPDNPNIWFNLGVLRLRLGRLTAEAWDAYEYVRLINGTSPWEVGRAKWQGEDIAGRTVLLAAEQGFGDTLQFVRYALLVKARGAHVVLVVQRSLARLLRGTPGVDQIVAVGEVLPAFDVYSPLLSLPRLFGTTLGSIPPALPYADRYEPWDDGTTGLRVGLVWEGSTRFKKNQLRSLPVAELARLAGIAGVQFYSLQRHEGVPPVLPPELGAIDLMGGVEDFADTAALVAGLDLVIAVDTAVAHLAATMGKPVWLLSRFRGCWRWLNEGEGSPWYPSVRVLRQAAPGDWGGVIDQVRRDLTALAAQPVNRAPPDQRRAEASGSRPCKACGVPATVVGTVDFNKNCAGMAEDLRPPPQRWVAYHRCPACALVFTCDFDGWDRETFQEHIYNDEYAKVDPDYYSNERPTAASRVIGTLLGDACRGLAALDYGGGNGALAERLSREHGMAAETYDPFNPACDVLPSRTYPLVTCFEVMEHTPDPKATVGEIAGLVQAEGLVVFSTLLQPDDFQQQGLDWWYAAPRNGHVTLYSAAALQALWGAFGFTVSTSSSGVHVAFRGALPAFAAHLAAPAAPQPSSGSSR